MVLWLDQRELGLFAALPRFLVLDEEAVRIGLRPGRPIGEALKERVAERPSLVVRTTKLSRLVERDILRASGMQIVIHSPGKGARRFDPDTVQVSWD